MRIWTPFTLYMFSVVQTPAYLLDSSSISGACKAPFEGVPVKNGSCRSDQIVQPVWGYISPGDLSCIILKTDQVCK